VTEQPTACVIEIYQTKPEKTDDTLAGSVIMPNKVLINGHPVLTQGGIRINAIEVPIAKDLASVTVTLLVRRIIVAAEGDMY
jgi:hypothetical protein